MKKGITFIFGIGLLLLSGASVAQGCNSSLAQYIKIFNEGYVPQKHLAAEQLEWLGESDPRIYDKIEKELLDRYEVATNGHEIKYQVALTRALGFSGNKQYRATLDKLSNNKKNRHVRKHAVQSLELLERHIIWNPIISDKSKFKKGKPECVNRFANMLHSDNLELNRLAAKRIIRDRIYDTYLLDLTSKALERAAATESLDRLGADSIAWLMKVLTSTIDEKYVAVVQNVADNSSHKKIKKLGAKYIKEYKW